MDIEASGNGLVRLNIPTFAAGTRVEVPMAVHLDEQAFCPAWSLRHFAHVPREWQPTRLLNVDGASRRKLISEGGKENRVLRGQNSVPEATNIGYIVSQVPDMIKVFGKTTSPVNLDELQDPPPGQTPADVIARIRKRKVVGNPTGFRMVQNYELTNRAFNPRANLVGSHCVRPKESEGKWTWQEE